MPLSFTTVGPPVKATVGATLSTVTTVVYSLKPTVAGLPSLTGPLFPRLAVGATLLIVTAAVSDVDRPGPASVAANFTVAVPLSVQLIVASVSDVALVSEQIPVPTLELSIVHR